MKKDHQAFFVSGPKQT